MVSSTDKPSGPTANAFTIGKEITMPASTSTPETVARHERADTRRRPPGSGLKRAGAAFTIALLIGLLSAPAHADCFQDAQGSDDQPGQKDLSEFCLAGTCGGSSTTVTWNFDDTEWTGNNTGDACALFD